MKVKVERVYWGDVETKYGTKQKIGIKTDVHGDKWLSCFENASNSKSLRAIKEGDSVEIIVEKHGDFLNFKVPGAIDDIKERLEKLEAAVFGTGKAETPKEDTEYPEPGQDGVPQPEDIPF